MATVASNIPKLYMIKGMRWFMLIVPVIVPFYKSNYLTMQQIMTLQSLFSISVVLLEVPSGYFADVWGRKKSIILGLFFSFLGLLTYSFAHGFNGFLIAELILGFGASFISGADSALLYDSLLELSRENDYKKIEGRNQAIGNFSEGAAGIIAGFIAVASIRYPFYIQTILTIPAIIVAFTLKEPKFHKESKRKPTLVEIIRVVKYALHDNKQVKWLLIYSSVISSSTLTMAWFAQPYFLRVGLPLSLFGIVWAALQFSVGFFSLSAHYIEQRMGRSVVLISLIFLVGIGYLSLSLTNALWGIGFIFIFYFVRGMNVPLLCEYVNKLTVPAVRATVLSVNALLFRLIFSILGPILGFLTDKYSLQFAFRACTIIFFFVGIITLFYLAKSGALTETRGGCFQ
jgi:MFS family permease